MMTGDELKLSLTRRAFLHGAGISAGACALPWLLARDARADGLAGRSAPHIAPRARNVILLHMVGGPSQLDLFDEKPLLRRLDGELCPSELIEGQRFAFLRGHPKLLGSPYAFQRHGESGAEVSELLPHLSQVVDDLTFIKSVHTDQINHAPAQLLLHTGSPRFGRPSIGSWISYGLGTVNENLPAYVVLVTGPGPGAGNALWSNGFLPGIHQGVEFRSSGDAVLFLSNPPGMEPAVRRRIIDAVQHLNREQFDLVGDPEIETRIAQYELAFRMQSSVPELTNIADEPASILAAYGAQPGDGSFATHCLLARRLVERGVRFVELLNSDWDHHNGLFEDLPKRCLDVDRPVAALIRDLKQRGLLDETLVVFCGEFGRTPMLQLLNGMGFVSAPGRDHHPDAFTIWLAGAGLKPGSIFGKTDDFGYRIVENPVHVHDLQATILHLLGIRHKKLTYTHLGREFRLTDVAGEIVREIIA